MPQRHGRTELAPLESYGRFFSHCEGSRYILEASPGYYQGDRQAIQQIKDILPDARIIIMFREPASRLLSFFTFYKSRLRLQRELGFDAYVDFCLRMPPEELSRWENREYWGLKAGFYAEHITDWFDVFGDQAIKVAFFEDFVRDPRGPERPVPVAGVGARELPAVPRYDGREPDHQFPGGSHSKTGIGLEQSQRIHVAFPSETESEDEEPVLLLQCPVISGQDFAGHAGPAAGSL